MIFGRRNLTLYRLFRRGCFLAGLLSCALTSAWSQGFENTLAGTDQSEYAGKQPHFFGEWRGERAKLLEKGVMFDLLYESDSLWNIRSAKKERLAVFARVRGTVDLDFSRLTHTHGLFFHMTAVWQGGGNLGIYLGAIAGPSGLASANCFRLDSWWLEKRFGELLVVRAGQFAGQDFYGTTLFGPSFIIEPLQYAFGNLYSTTYENFDPPSTPAAEVRLIPTSHFYIKSMVNAAIRNPYAYNQTGFVPQFRGDPMLLSEIGYSPGRKAYVVRSEDNIESRRGYSGLYRFGVLYNPGSFISSSSSKPVSGNYLIYGNANQALYRTSNDTDHGIDLTVGADWSPRYKNRNNQDFTAGLRFNEPLPVSLHSTIGLGYVRGGINRSFPLLPPNPIYETKNAENAFELNCLLQLPRGILIQPVVQHYINVGGSSSPATILGFHAKIDF